MRLSDLLYLPVALYAHATYLWRTRNDPGDVSREEYYRTLDAYYAEAEEHKRAQGL